MEIQHTSRRYVRSYTVTASLEMLPSKNFSHL